LTSPTVGGARIRRAPRGTVEGDGAEWKKKEEREKKKGEERTAVDTARVATIRLGDRGERDHFLSPR
jgi:hypothetical protein